MFTRAEAGPDIEQYIAFSWADFRGKAKLRDVPVRSARTRGGGGTAGTRLVLSGLREREVWQAPDKIRELQRRLSAMISPFEEASDFHVHLEVDGKHLELAEIHKRLRDTAQLRYSFEFDGERFRVRGLARLSYFRPGDKRDQRLLEMIVGRDKGRALFEFLVRRTGRGRPSQLSHSDRQGWFVGFATERALDDLPRLRRADGSAVSPGPFRGEVDAVSLESSDARRAGIGRVSEYRQLVGDLAGIRVYRDGFGIRVGEDWLGLGRQWTGGGSYYGLRPGNVLGFVKISARDNPNLVETTSREGFQETPHYENFLALLSEFVRFAGETQEFLRRGAVDFLKEHEDRKAGVESDDDHSSITRRIGDVAERLTSHRKVVERQVGSLRKAAGGAAKTLGNVRGELKQIAPEDETVSRAIVELEGEIGKVTKAEERIRKRVAAALDHASELKATQEILDRRWAALDEHVNALYESVSLGLTAEVLSHEINNIADRLAQRSAAVRREVRKGLRRATVVTYIEEVRSSVVTMRKQLTHLTPSLRYLRESREPIEMTAFLKELAEFYEERLSANGIVMVLKAQEPSFVVNMNKGKLTQVFDNLILNSEYWLKEAIRAKAVRAGEIDVSVDAPRVRLRDNGRGVEEVVEGILFEPFVTMKRKGEGRGLGLFVCRQLLESESCGIDLLPDRNDRRRKHVFELDLSGAVDE